VITWDYDHLLPDGRVERLSAQARHYLAPSEELISEFNTAGLEVTASFGDYDRSEYTHRSPYLILIAQAAEF